MATPRPTDPENMRLAEISEQNVPWRKWGPYLSERQWGTVREDYSRDGNSWEYFTHDQARSRAYRWGEDGIAGISDEKQRLCFGLALWNGQDPIIKERLFGLNNREGNHGEDVKEYYYYLDSTPTHSYMKFLYKYPQEAYPYDDLVATNAERSRLDYEYELIDTGVFDNDRYFDVVVEFAKATPEELLFQITVVNRGDRSATIHVLPTVWFRNTWSFGDKPRPRLQAVPGLLGMSVIQALHADLGERYVIYEGNVPLLFTENETNRERIFRRPNETPYVKDAFDTWLVHGVKNAVNPDQVGTKAAAHYEFTIGAGQSKVVRLRLSQSSPTVASLFGESFEQMMRGRHSQADAFYEGLYPAHLGPDERNVIRQAMAGMLWTKQYYYFDLEVWLREHHHSPLSPSSDTVRNKDWFHMTNDDIISMPDKWEYPWYAAWDLAFHTVALSMVDIGFAKSQLELLTTEAYFHPNGQMPAYEWNFGDVNPPVHPWASWFVYNLEKQQTGQGDIDFLKRIFYKLLLNFTWWVNRKDRNGRNVFEGGFLGLDNIGVFDRSAPLPGGAYLEQADGTAWMALFCQNMAQIAVELSADDPASEELVVKFVEHFFWIANAVFSEGEQKGMWDEEDGFFYDLLRLPDGTAQRLKVRSMVGLLPLCAVSVYPGDLDERLPNLSKRLRRRATRMPKSLERDLGHITRRGYQNRACLSLLNEERLRRILARMLDPEEFLGDYGIRAMSRYHLAHPYVFHHGTKELRVTYRPAESDTGMFGGNSNWRGPIWMPVNALLIRGLLQLYAYYGDEFKVECPTGSGQHMTLYEVARELTRRLSSIFLRDGSGHRPVHGGVRRFQEDPHWRDLILFYEYFHGDNGAGLGASHQTGWTGVVARLMQIFAVSDAATALRDISRVASGAATPEPALPDAAPSAGRWTSPEDR